MLANGPERPNRPNGRTKWLRQAARVTGTIGVVALMSAIVLGLRDSAAPSISVGVQRVAYISYVDDANDERGRVDFEHLEEALRSVNANAGTAAYSLDFIKVVVDGPQTIDARLRDLVRSEPAVIVATSHDVLQAAKAATQTIPILFMSYADPVETGNVLSIAEPGVRRTGFTFRVPLLRKAIELLIDGYPATRRIGLLIDTLAASQPDHLREIEQARTKSPVRIDVFVADNKRQLAAILRSDKARAIDAWYVPVGAAIWYDRAAVIRMMAATSRPVLYDRTSIVRDGGLMSYEARVVDPFRIWASQLLLILHGVDAATIPVERPSQFELALNLDAVASDTRLRPSRNIIERANVLVAQRP